MNSTLRFFGVPAVSAFRYQAKANVTSPSVMLIWIFSPITQGSIAALLYKSLGADQLAVYAVLGSVISGSWTTALFLSLITLSNDRWGRVLELGLATPARLSGIMLGKLFAGALQGLIAAAIAVGCVSLFATTVVDIHRPLLVLATLPFVMLGVGSFALLFSPMLFLTRGVVGIVALLDSGLMFVSAVLYPLSTLPGWVQVIARASPLRWCVQALVTAASDTHPASDTFAAWGMVAGLSALYGSIALVAYEFLERRLRRTGELGTF